MCKRLSAILLLLCCILAPATLAAQGNMSRGDRQRWLNEIRTYKHDFLAEKLSLTREQQNTFFPLYDEMEDRIEALNTETREIENRVTDDASASDTEVKNAARAIFELKQAEGTIELEYFEKFKDILQPRQLLQLKNAERQFTRQLVNKHRRMGRTAAQPED